MTSILIWPTLAWSPLVIPLFLVFWLVIGLLCAGIAALLVGGVAWIYALTNDRKVGSPLMHFGGLVLAGFVGQGIGAVFGTGLTILFFPNADTFVMICFALGPILLQIIYLVFVWPNLEK